MATENPVFQILAPTGNQALLTAGQRMDNLAVGQLGIFNYHTGLSVDGTAPENAQDIFMAVGLSRSGGPLDDMAKSAGQYIPVRLAKSLTVKGYVPNIAKVVEITGFGAKCETNYSVKIELRSQQGYGVAGYNQISETFDYFTGCCAQADCVSCPQGDANELAQGLVDNINAQPEHWTTASLFVNVFNTTVATAATATASILVTIGTETFSVPVTNGDSAAVVAGKIAAFINTVTASAYKASATGAVISVYPKTSKTANATTIVVTPSSGVTVNTTTTGNSTISDLPTFEAAHPGVFASVRITANAAAATNPNGNIPIKYYSGTYQDIIVSLTDGFDCNGAINVATQLQMEDGAGQNLAFEEYEAGGWNGKPGPYRTSAITGLQKGDYNSSINPAAKYNQVVLTYDIESVGGWLEYKNNIQTNIAIPCADGTTLTGLFTVLDLIFTRFGAMTNDVAAMDCTNTNVTTINDYALDGIESLA